MTSNTRIHEEIGETISALCRTIKARAEKHDDIDAEAVKATAELINSARGIAIY